jgi:aminopeptidase-like protein
MTTMMEMLRELTPLNRVVCSTDFDRTVEYVRGVLPCDLLEYPASGVVHNGWVIPPKWDVVEATISRDGRVVYDGTCHPLGVIALSAPFDGCVSLEELRRHLHYDHRYGDSLTFHFRQLFRSWERDWGFCVPKDVYDSLEPGDYDVRIETREEQGVLKVLTSTHRGASPYTVALCANLDHPGVSNDGLAGAVVGTEVLRRLEGRTTTLSYTLVLAPGIIGTEYYLGGLGSDVRARMLECLCLWMLGSRTELALQDSRASRSNMEEALAWSLDRRGIDFRRGEFESIIINDEYLWEAYGIPTCSLSRFPYPEYHSSRDDVAIMSEESLEEAVTVILQAVERIEATPLVVKRFEGTMCLANPRYNIYVDPGQVSFGERVADQQRRLRLLQDYLPSLNLPETVRRLAARFGLPDEVVLGYLRTWREKGLVELLGDALPRAEEVDSSARGPAVR